MNRLIDRQRDWNAASRESWESAARHRQRVTDLLLESSLGAKGRACLLGAGNCNDHDLARLQTHFGELHLVDLDGEALQAGIEKQGIRSDSLVLHGGDDLSGIFTRLASWDPGRAASDEDVLAAIDAARAAPVPNLNGPFEVVASCCLLSQLIESIVVTLGAQHPRFLELLQAVRLRHLELLVQLTAPGGVGLLITDIVSSESAPQLVDLHPNQLPRALASLIAARNFFHGLNPGVLFSLLNDDPQLASHTDNVEVLAPWMWDFGRRQYAVVAIRFRCRSS